jgi:diguanylate cyclase (GGDEF)-like protein
MAHLFGVKKHLAIFLIFLILFTNSIDAQAATSTSKKNKSEQVVTVGYYYREGFQEGTKDGAIKKGYAYEYLQKISSITGWKYKYIYGTWDEIYKKFTRGEIDLLAGLDYVEFRTEDMNYPEDPMGDEVYFIFANTSNSSVSSNTESLNGKKIGVVRGLLVDILSDWLKKHNITAEIVAYADFLERDAALEEGQIDCSLDESVMSAYRDTVQPLVKVAEAKMYLCTAKNRTDLLKQLNDAQDRMNMEDPYYKNALIQKYYNYNGVSRNLTEEEQAWIEDKKIIKVGYFDNYLPYSGTDKFGNPTGALIELLPAVLRNVGLEDKLQIKYTKYKDSTEMVKDLRDEKIDLAFPVTDNVYFLEQSGIYSSRSCVNADTELIYKGKYDEKTMSKVAVNRNNLYQINYLKVNSPGSKLVYCNSIDECLKYIAANKASCTILNSYRSNFYLDNSKYNGFSSLTMSVTSNRCFGVNRSNNIFLSILNRGIGSLPQDYMINIMYKYDKGIRQYTLLDYIREHSIESVVVAVGIFLVMILFIGIILNKSKYQKIYDVMAHRDSMTSLFNRRAYEEKFNALAKEGVPDDLVYVSMDINGLKVVNDTLGHDAGDELIKGASSCFRSALKFYGNVYRTGGDEFIGIIQASEREVHDIKQVLNEKINAWSGELVDKAHISVGFVEKREFPDYSIVDIAKEADKRMYDMKNEYYQHMRKNQK